MADRFLVATGNSSSTAVWSASSGGAGGASVPGVADNAIADANSNGFTLTVDTALSVVNLTFSSTTAQLVLGANLTCSGTLTLVGTAGTRFYLRSGTRGTARTVTAATVALQYVDLEDITGAGAGSWDLSAITGLSGDCGGNSGITFTTPGTEYLRGSSNRSFSTAGNWANAVGGAAGSGRVPLPQDTAYLDATTGSGTITQDLPRVGALVCTGHTGTLTWTLTSTAYGSITLATGQTLTSSTASVLTLSGRGTQTITCNGLSWARPMAVAAPGGKWQLSDDLVIGATRLLYLYNGELDANGYNVTAGGLNISVASGATATITPGAGTWTFNGDLDPVTTSVSGTLNVTASSGLVRFTGALTADRTARFSTSTWNNIQNSTTGAYAIILRGTLTGNTLTVDAGRTQKFYRGETRTFSSYALTGTAGSPVTLASDTTSAATLAKNGGGTVEIQYATIDYLTGSPDSTFYAYNSTDGGHNSQIYFATAKSATVGIDALIAEARSAVVSLDALIAEARTSTVALDALIQIARSVGVSLDALIQIARTSSVSLDAIIAVPGATVAAGSRRANVVALARRTDTVVRAAAA